MVPALPTFADRLHLSAPQVALIFALFPLGHLIAATLGAGFLERTGRRPAMIAALLLMAVATLGFASAQTVALLVVTRLLQGIAAGLAWTSAIAAISDVFPSDQLGFRISAAQAAGGAGGLAGPVVGGIGIELLGIAPTFAIAATVPLLLLVPLLVVPETGRREAGQGVPRYRQLLRVMSTVRARVAAVALLTFAAVIGAIEPLLPLDLDERLGASAAAIGLLFALLIGADLILAPASGLWSDRSGRVPPLLAGGLMIAVALPATAVGSLWSVGTAAIVLGAGLGALGAGVGALMTEAVDEVGLAGNYGLSAGLLSALFSIGSLAGPLFGALARTVLPYAATMILLALVCAAATLWCALALSRSERRRAA